MALSSPGVQVSVIDESFYTPAEPGTRPLFIVASAQDKLNGSSTGTAQGTLASNAGRVYLITSQRDLVDTFGDPTFQVDANNNPIHAGELNEYGLQAAYSYLGVSNSAFIVRADLDLNKLIASANAPGGAPVDGTFWLDSESTNYGIFEWNGAPATSTGGQSFTNKVPTIISVSGSVPADSVGAVGTYAMVFDGDNTATGTTAHELTLYYKSAFTAEGDVGLASWAKVGSDQWVRAHAVIKSTPNTSIPPVIGDDIVFSVDGAITTVSITGTTLTAIADDISGSAAPIGARVVNGLFEIYAKNNDVNIVRILATDGGTPSPIESTQRLLTFLGLTASPTVGYYAPRLEISKHTEVPQWRKNRANNIDRPTGSVWIKTTEPNLGARWRVNVYNDTTQLWDAVEAPLYPTNQAALAGMDVNGGGIGLPVNSVYVQYNISEFDKPLAEFRVMRRARAGATTFSTSVIGSGTLTAGSKTITIGASRAGSTGIFGSGSNTSEDVTFNAEGTADDALKLVGAINTANIPDVVAERTTDGRVVISHLKGGEIRFASEIAVTLGLAGNTNVYTVEDEDEVFTHIASNWIPRTFAGTIRTYYIDGDAPQTLVADGDLWYSSVVDEVDLMIHNGSTWVGYGTVYPQTDTNGPIVGASQPLTLSDGTTEIGANQDGQIWIDTSDLENYPTVKRWNGDLLKWETLDKSDQTTENGVLFADARWSTSGANDEPASIAALNRGAGSDFLDFDAPDPALYPRGMILWNLRRSGFNVKRFVRNYVDPTGDNIRMNDVSMSTYYPHRWVTESGNQADGSGSFGRHAQRKVVIQALQALVNSNQDIRDTEVRTFNLLACPGYPELIGEMITLNYDRGLTSFIVGDTPPRLRPDATTINDWGNNVALALQDDDDGLVSFDEYLGVFYPWGFTSDNAGRDVAVPPSHMILRMMALSDQVSYPWFAPAGTRRGGITNASAVGYISDEGEFVSVALNEGQRDTLYNVKVNPITFFTGAGLVNFGQKTRARNASALDRINVARLVIYLRSQLNRLAKPYIFEPNDKITRDEIKQQVESLLLELVGQRALYDYLVVCDESNNTPNRIDRNELYVDIAIEPVKAVEFIYIPVRLKNTGEIAGL